MEYDALTGRIISDRLMNTPEWGMAESFLANKEYVVDGAYPQTYQAQVNGEVLNIIRGSSIISPDASTAEIVLVENAAGNISAWIMVTNLPPHVDDGIDQTARTIPVAAWSNGKPVFYVHFYHLIRGAWVPFYYWWHEPSNHPNWYYSVYNYWWWYYDWYDIDWWWWYDWFFAWYYGVRFYYWSTWFPIGEPIAALLFTIPFLLLGRRYS